MTRPARRFEEWGPEAPATRAGTGSTQQGRLLAAVSAPSSLAVELAADVGITLVGLLRGDGCNVYTRPERIVLPE